MLTEPFKVAAPEICGGELRQRWSQWKGVTLLIHCVSITPPYA